MLYIVDVVEADLNWMFKLFVQSANKGHFRMTNNKEGREQIKRNLQSIISNNEIVDLGLPAEILIFANEKGRIGYSVICDTPPDLQGKEIYIFVVDKVFRNHGYGNFMLGEILSRWTLSSDIYARCFPVSQAMSAMLYKSGFTLIGKNSDGADVYRLVSQAS